MRIFSVIVVLWLGCASARAQNLTVPADLLNESALPRVMPKFARRSLVIKMPAPTPIRRRFFNLNWPRDFTETRSKASKNCARL